MPMRRLALENTGWEPEAGREAEDWHAEELRAPLLVGAVKVMGGAQLLELQSSPGLFIDRAGSVSGHGAGRVGASAGHAQSAMCGNLHCAHLKIEHRIERSSCRKSSPLPVGEKPLL